MKTNPLELRYLAAVPLLLMGAALAPSAMAAPRQNDDRAYAEFQTVANIQEFIALFGAQAEQDPSRQDRPAESIAQTDADAPPTVTPAPAQENEIQDASAPAPEEAGLPGEQDAASVPASPVVPALEGSPAIATSLSAGDAAARLYAMDSALSPESTRALLQAALIMSIIGFLLIEQNAIGAVANFTSDLFSVRRRVTAP